MYNQRRTEKQIEVAERELSLREPGFRTKRRTVSEIISLNDELYSLSDPNNQAFTKQLSKSHREAVLSERILCKWDFRYWLENYHFIIDWKTQKYVRMKPNTAQEIMLDVYSEMEEEGFPIDTQNLKARQLGITTLFEALIEHRVTFHPNTRAVVGSANPEKSAKMVNMIEESWKRIPFWIMPERTKYKAGELSEFGGIGSWLSVYHGAQKTSFARGETPNVAHLSEIIEWLHPETDIDAGLIFAMHSNPLRILGLESTAGYIGDWFYRQWQWNKQRWGQGGEPARLRPIFLPWFVGRDLYPTPTEEKQYPAPKGWKPSEEVRKHAIKAEEYVRGTELLRRHLGRDWRMPIEQQWWWEYTRNYYKQAGQLNDFYREVPANDVECFSSKYSSVFDAEVVHKLQGLSKPPEDMYVLDGPLDEVREELKPDRRLVDTERPPITVDKRYTLYPLRKDEWSPMMNPEGILFMWERPEDRNEYGLGVDTAKGLGQDRSVIEGMRKATSTRIARQVCEFASSYISANDLPPWVHCIGRLYSTLDDRGERLQPKMAIEIANGGDACQLAMKKMGWGNFHNWIRIDKKIIDEGKAHYHGFVMTEWARDMVFGNMIKAIKDGLLDIDSPWLLEEMGTLEKDEEKRRIDHTIGMHDDRFVALGLILSSLHALDWEGLKSTFGRARIMQELPTDAPVEKKYARQPKVDWVAVAKRRTEERIFAPNSDEWDGYDPKYAPEWRGE